VAVSMWWIEGWLEISQVDALLVQGCDMVGVARGINWFSSDNGRVARSWRERADHCFLGHVCFSKSDFR